MFSYPEAAIFEFKKQLGDLLYKAIPQRFRKVLEIRQRKNPDILSTNDVRLLERNQNIKVLFAIREDRYSQLHQLKDYLPDIMHHRYLLAPINRVQASKAIEIPASKIGNYKSDS